MVHNLARRRAAPGETGAGWGESTPHGDRLRRTSQERGRPVRREHRRAQGASARQELRQGGRGRGRSGRVVRAARRDRKSTRLNSSHVEISYAVFCLKKKTKT